MSRDTRYTRKYPRDPLGVTPSAVSLWRITNHRVMDHAPRRWNVAWVANIHKASYSKIGKPMLVLENSPPENIPAPS